MMRISYQPAFDTFHTAFRLMRIREFALADISLARDHVRILDFYLLFPFRIEQFRLKPAHRKFRKLARRYADAAPYGARPEDRMVFTRMRSIQSVALDTLAAKSLIDPEQFSNGVVAKATADLPPSVAMRVDAINSEEEDLVEFLLVLASEYDLLGDDGLKARSELMEHRYDAI
jgi:hypothetical protein